MAWENGFNVAMGLFPFSIFMIFGHALDLLIVFAAAILIGAGKYSLDTRLLPKIA